MLFKGMIRPLLEYGHCVWQPCEKGLCSEIENVQRRATRMLSHLQELPYPERLKKLKLPSLEHRRLRGDMIETYKYLNGLYDTEQPKFVIASALETEQQHRHLRGHSKKLHKPFYRRKIRTNFFSNRIITTWNSLPESVISAPSTNAFKNRLDEYWKDLPSVYNPTCQN